MEVSEMLMGNITVIAVVVLCIVLFIKVQKAIIKGIAILAIIAAIVWYIPNFIL